MLELISKVRLLLGGIWISCISLIPFWDQKRSGERQLDPSLLGPAGWWDVIWVRERVAGSIMSVLRSVWVWVQVGGRLILLICESCQRPLEDASVSGRVTYSYIVHTREGRIQVQGCVAEVSYREHLFPDILCGFRLENQLKWTPEPAKLYKKHRHNIGHIGHIETKVTHTFWTAEVT